MTLAARQGSQPFGTVDAGMSASAKPLAVADPRVARRSMPSAAPVRADGVQDLEEALFEVVLEIDVKRVR